MKYPSFVNTHNQQRLFRTIGTLVSATTLLTSQSLWLFTQPVLADKLDASSTAICGIPGQDGSATGVTGQVNTYFSGSSASAAAGTSSITVGTATGTTGIKPGDLLLIIQMQGADIDSTNSNTYGDGSSGNNPNQGATNYPAGGVVNGNSSTNFTAGNFEYAVATNTVGTGGGTINLSSPLVNSYSNVDNTSNTAQGQRRFQVIRVPQYADLTISGTITAAPWDGAKGGIVAIDVAGKLTFSGGQINVDGLGFRGGGGRQLAGGSGANTDVRTLSTNAVNGSKGEGTAGTPKYLFNPSNNTLITNSTTEGYPNGSYGRGAPGNAGGGGTDGNPVSNDQNSGGGGGSNGGLGGKGGRTWSTSLPYGGDGGAAFPTSASANRLVMGGGGGAGSTNDGTGTPGSGLASSGAPGGGMVLLRTGNIAGTGTINANGATPALTPANDASGGGGAGGSVLVISQNANLPATLAINANGGKGGTNTGGGSPHGPGGGGGGGVVYLSPGSAAYTLSGGQPGTTTGGVFGGATAGEGLFGPVSTSSSNATTSISGANCLINVTKTTSTPGPFTAPSTATYTITASNPAGAKRAGASQVVISDDGLPTGFTHTPVAITPIYTNGATGPASVTSSGTGATSTPSWSGFTIPPGGSISITFTVNIASGTAAAKYNNSATASAKYINSSASATTVSGTAAAVASNYDGTVTSNTGEDVTIIPPSNLTVDKTVAVVVDSDKSGGTTPLASQVATPGDILEYTINVKNTSTSASATSVILNDTIPTNTTYFPGSLQITTGANNGVKTDALSDDQAEYIAASSKVVFRLGTGASVSSGGTLGTTAANNTTTIKFQVKVNDPIPSGVSSVSNQAIVSSSGFGDANSNDPGTTASGDPTVSKIGPRLRLVKRVTGIRKVGSATVTSVGGYNNLGTDINDDAGIAWPGGSSTYLLGAITDAQIPTNPGIPAPKDEVEYTIYFLSDGAMNAQSVNICDFLPANQTYVAGSMQLNFNGTTTAIADGSGTGPNSGFYTSSFPTSCLGTNNGKGAAYFQVGTVAPANATPSTSYGYIRFRAKVN